jgi:hypothetical protein
MDDDLLARCLRAEQNAAESTRTLHAIQYPLETISNLSYLACHTLLQPEQSKAYLEALDTQVQAIAALLDARFRPLKKP